MLSPLSLTARDSGRRRAPLHPRQGLKERYFANSSCCDSEASLKRRSKFGITPSQERVKWYSDRLPSHLNLNSFFPEPCRTTLRSSAGSFFQGVFGLIL